MNWMNRVQISFVALLSAAWVAGCAHRDDEGAFDVTLVQVNPSSGGGLGETALNCEIRLQNGNPEPVTVDGGRHKVYLNGVYIGQGLSNESVEVPRLGTTTQRVTVYLSTFQMARSLHKIYESHRADYRLESTVYARQGSHSHSFKAEKEGSIDLNSLQSPRATESAPSAH